MTSTFYCIPCTLNIMLRHSWSYLKPFSKNFPYLCLVCRSGLFYWLQFQWQFSFLNFCNAVLIVKLFSLSSPLILVSTVCSVQKWLPWASSLQGHSPLHVITELPPWVRVLCIHMTWSKLFSLLFFHPALLLPISLPPFNPSFLFACWWFQVAFLPGSQPRIFRR